MKPGDKVLCICDDFDYSHFPPYLQYMLDYNHSIFIEKGKSYTVKSIDGLGMITVEEKPALAYEPSFFEDNTNGGNRPNDSIYKPYGTDKYTHTEEAPNYKPKYSIL